MSTLPVTLQDIRVARQRIADHIRRTPMEADPHLPNVILKCEYRQETGAFKLRGATNAVLSLSDPGRRAGVITASTGNHGRALAYAARAVGTRATVCLSQLVPDNKITAIRDLGADVRVIGASQDEAMEEVSRAVAREGMTRVDPFDDPAVIAGQGTIGLEILEDCPAPDAILVPLSGGGLASGIAIAVKARRPQARVIGVSMDRGAAMAASLDAGHPVDVTEGPSLADSLGGGIGLQNRVTFPICQALLDDVILVTEGEIAEAMRHLAHIGHVVEGAAVVGHAAILAGKFSPKGPTVTILSGGNVDQALHARIIAGANSVEAA